MHDDAHNQVLVASKHLGCYRGVPQRAGHSEGHTVVPCSTSTKKTMLRELRWLGLAREGRVGAQREGEHGFKINCDEVER